ncbi:MAG TPA: EVE domain-containing protein [Planktothrix sp.]|jgi:predicted RNA-binding protein with PUA-like domain
MAYWLFKTEPSSYSYDDLERDKKTTWDGVTNALALKYLRQIRKGDQALIYHTGDVRSVIGVAEVSSEPYVDPKENDAKLVVVDLKPKKRLGRSVSLAEIKADKEFEDCLLVKMGRLSVLPVTDTQWKKLTT